MPVNLAKLKGATPAGAAPSDTTGSAGLPHSFSDFGQNAYQDVKGMAEGLIGIPSLIGRLATHPIDTGEQIISGAYNQIKDELTDPVGHFLRQPVSSALDLLTVGGIARGAALKAGMAATTSPRLAKLLRLKELTEAEKVSREALFVRHGEIAARSWESKLNAAKVAEKYAPAVREDMTFYAEKTRNAKLGKADSFEAVKERLASVPGATETADNLASRRQQFWEEANASGLTKEMGFVENYISHFYEGSEGQVRGAASKFAMRNQHAQSRRFFTYEDAMDAGLKPKTLDAAELTRMYETNLIRVTENNRMIKTLKDLVIESDGTVIRAKGPSWLRDAMIVSGKNPRRLLNDVDLGNPSIREAVMADPTLTEAQKLRVLKTGTIEDMPKIGGTRAIVSGGERVPPGYIWVNHRALGPTGGFVHPEVAPAIKAVLDKPFDGNFARRVSKLNAFAKKSALSLSFFHHIVLTEAAFGALGFKGLSVLKSGGFRRGLEILKDEAKTEEALRAGLNLGPLADVQAGHVVQGLERMESKLKGVPILGKAATGIKKANEIWDKALWDTYHTGLKSYAFHELYQKALSKSPGVAKEIVAREVASFVNDAFGGQTWELMLKSPKWQQAAHWTLLAPDWTISNARIFMRPFGTGPTAALGREYWRRTALASFTTTSALNYAMTKYFDGEGRFPWENEPGKRLFNVMVGRDEKGRRQYANFGKQLQEPLRWIYEPIKQFGGKLSPAIQIAVEQLTGSSTSGYPMEFKEAEGGSEITGRLEAIGKKFVPISFSSGNVGFSLPRSAGTTGYKVVAGLKRSLKENDNRALMEWLKAASDNGYNAKQLLGIARMELKREAKQK